MSRKLAVDSVSRVDYLYESSQSSTSRRLVQTSRHVRVERLKKLGEYKYDASSRGRPNPFFPLLTWTRRRLLDAPVDPSSRRRPLDACRRGSEAPPSPAPRRGSEAPPSPSSRAPPRAAGPSCSSPLQAVHKMIIDAGAYPSPLGYGGFPKSVCTSVNECMCHGIPDSRELKDGDIINIDVTVYLNGFHGDTSKTFFCGEVDEAAKRLVKVTEECMLRGISACKHGVSFKKIGRRISEHAERHGFGVVEQFVGHGVGRVFHSQPIIYHQRNNMPGQMVEGQTFTIEPILTMGGSSIECDMWEDGWTAVTTDGSLAAQFEHTILITRTGAEILTKC
ncbi:methionine aminopeptidase 1B, chloroplastic-like isoform X2 [Triticum dicoccoides]|uniref:methionine aminopeptidase 1B, chloroplastic-like isoform X2 n=1 Tax=Triticum dicoccoides TaxID=85692 RepID=UPI00188E1ED5|nr:methionine aminopeptidase 1B, chloroplastic-like isoform X2 [Triticum dicoccoides]